MSDKTISKVLHICKVYLPIRGGIQNVVHNITSLLKSYSHTVITTGKDGAIHQESMENANVVRCRSFGEIASMPIAPTLISKLCKQSKNSQLIALHYPFPLAELALFFTPLFTLFQSPPIVVHWHSEIIAQKKLKWLVAPLTWIILFRAKAIVVTSERMMKPSFFLRCFQNKIKFIPYGLKSITIQPNKIKTKQDYYLIIGRHVSYKGMDVAIKAFKHIRSKLVIIGSGSLYDRHVKLVDDLKLKDQIKFIRYASNNEVDSLLAYSKALIVPSVMENEAFALVQLEAMRLSKPVINTNLQSSVPWVARDQQEALTITPRSVDELVIALEQLNSDQSLLKRLGVNGHRRYCKVFSSDQFNKSITDLYSEIIERSR